MNNRYVLTLTVLFISIFLFECNCKHVCSSSAPYIKLVNFDSSSLRSVIVKAYNNNGQFNQLQSTRVLTSGHLGATDTSTLDTNIILLDFFTDYSVEFPSISRLWYIRGISMQPTKMAAGDCTNGFSYYLNDTLHSIPPAAGANSTFHVDIAR